MGYTVSCRAFHTAPVQGQGLTPIVPYFSGSGPCLYTGHSQCDYTIRVTIKFLNLILKIKCPGFKSRRFLFRSEKTEKMNYSINN